MTSFPLFGGVSPPRKNTLVEFRAGKMTMKNKIVHADKRRGMVYMYQADDSLMHFCWKDRKTGSVEDDLILFPGDAVFKRVPECTTGRVYVMKFKASSKRFFYWLQEPKTDNDDEFCHQVNHYMNNPLSSVSSQTDRINEDPASSGSGSFSISGLSSLNHVDLQTIVNNMSHQQLIQLLNELERVSREPSSNELTDLHSFPTPQPSEKSQITNDSITPSDLDTATPDSSDSIHQDNLQDKSPKHFPSESEGMKTYLDLSSVITAEVLQPLIDNNKDLISRIEKFLPSLPDTEEEIPQEHLKSTMQSPDFKFALRTFGKALQFGHLGTLMKEFGLSSEIINAADSGDLDAFVEALQSSAEEGTSESISAEVKELDEDSDKHSN